MKTYFVYILASKRNGTLYIGVTSNLLKRVWNHRFGEVSSFTKKHGVFRLVYFETDNRDYKRNRTRKAAQGMEKTVE